MPPASSRWSTAFVHNAEIVAIEGESYRLKEARERTEQRARQRRAARS